MDNLITENLRGFEIKFKTKPGIFSKTGLDAGTKLLIDNLRITDGTLIADLGSGTGIMGLVCAKLNPSGHVHLLEDHLRSYELNKENVDLNNLRNVESYLSDLFSATSKYSYHQIISNPPAQMGNDFLEEVVSESYRHLKTKGSLWVVVPSNLSSVIERLFKKYFSNSKIVTHGKEHVVLKTQKNGK